MYHNDSIWSLPGVLILWYLKGGHLLETGRLLGTGRLLETGRFFFFFEKQQMCETSFDIYLKRNNNINCKSNRHTVNIHLMEVNFENR